MSVSSRNRPRPHRKYQATPTDHPNFNEFLGVEKVAEAPKENPPAHMAIWSTLLAIVLLSIFTIRTVSLLF
jgi:hypothetical protein